MGESDMKIGKLFFGNNFAFALISGCVGFMAMGCETRTSKAICTDSNAAVLPGVSGTYTISLPSDDFSVSTQEIIIDTKASKSIFKLSNIADDGEFGRLCQVGKYIVNEVKSDDGVGFSQSVLSFTGAQLSIQTVLFDRPTLDEMGVESIVQNRPTPPTHLGQSVFKNLIGQLHFNKGFGTIGLEHILVIQNETISPERLWKAAHLSAVALTLNRK